MSDGSALPARARYRSENVPPLRGTDPGHLAQHRVRCQRRTEPRTGQRFDRQARETGKEGSCAAFGDGRAQISVEMPLRELMRGFFDEIKSISQGYASISYEIADYRKADVCKLDLVVADEPVAAFARVVSKRRVQEEAEKAVEKLHSVLPRQMFVAKIQGIAMGRILSSKTLSAFSKDVTQHMYGGDITRKMKLREKQKKGKKKMAARGKGNIDIPQDVFIKMMKNGD